MRFSYNKLWKLLIDKNLSKKGLSEISGVSSTTLAKMKKGGNVNTEALLRICASLGCDISDIMEIAEN